MLALKIAEAHGTSTDKWRVCIDSFRLFCSSDSIAAALKFFTAAWFLVLTMSTSAPTFLY